jgi:hypothetical protein
MISRKSFDPPPSVEALNTKTFNIVPARDPIPMFDDKAQLFQNIQCRAPYNGTLRVIKASAENKSYSSGGWGFCIVAMQACSNTRILLLFSFRLYRLSRRYPISVRDHFHLRNQG